jgi:hypothetical protein
MREHGPVPARLERFGRVGQGRVPDQRFGGAVVGLRCAGYAAPPSGQLWPFGYVQTVLPEHVPGARATGRSWSRQAVAGPGPRFALRCKWLTAVQVAMPRPAGCLSGCPDHAPGTQVPKPPRCTTRAANRVSESCPITGYVQRPQVLDPDPATQVPTRTPPCIRGQIIGIDQHDHLLLKSRSLRPMEIPDLDISDISDQLLTDRFLIWISLISQIST